MVAYAADSTAAAGPGYGALAAADTYQ
jgi:hypothetical protein